MWNRSIFESYNDFAFSIEDWHAHQLLYVFAEMGFAGVDVQPLPGKNGQRSMHAKFPASLDGLNKASQLVELFERQGHGRAAWARVRSIASDGANHPMVMKVDAKGERTWVLYGYLATAWDLDMLDPESKQNVTVKSRKELDLD